MLYTLKVSALQYLLKIRVDIVDRVDITKETLKNEICVCFFHLSILFQSSAKYSRTKFSWSKICFTTWLRARKMLDAFSKIRRNRQFTNLHKNAENLRNWFFFYQFTIIYCISLLILSYKVFFIITSTFWTIVLEGLKDKNASRFYLMFFLKRTLNINWRFEINLSNFPLLHSSNNSLLLLTYFEQNSSYSGHSLKPKTLRYTQNSQWRQNSSFSNGKNVFVNLLVNS